jgi:L-ascorbate metabolism protein UlaG (beta-lactamase superfamily)
LAIGLLTLLLGLGGNALAGEPVGRPGLASDRISTDKGDVVVRPINHATFTLEWNGKTIDVDPVGGVARFSGSPPPDAILLTDIHADHLDEATLSARATPATVVVAPAAVAERLSGAWRARLTILANGATSLVAGIAVEAVAMYNTTPERLSYHPKGRGNGYVLTFANRRVYVSGDTEDIPEMRALRGIDAAFVCMNLPYTMTVDQAASAVAAFRPRVVYPYHSRGSDLQRFKELAGKTSGVEVRLLQWYP